MKRMAIIPMHMMVPRIPKAHLVVCHSALALTILESTSLPNSVASASSLDAASRSMAFGWPILSIQVADRHLFKYARDRRAVGAVAVLVGLAFVVVAIAVMISIMLTSKLARSVANSPNTRTSTSRTTIIDRCANNYGAFSCVVNCGLCGEMSREAHSINIHRNISISLGFDVKCSNADGVSTFNQVSGPGSGTQ